MIGLNGKSCLVVIIVIIHQQCAKCVEPKLHSWYSQLQLNYDWFASSWFFNWRFQLRESFPTGNNDIVEVFMCANLVNTIISASEGSISSDVDLILCW